MKPSAVAVGVPKVGVNAVPTNYDHVTNDVPAAYPVRVVVIVTVELVPAATPVTVTKPSLSIDTVPPVSSVPDHEKFAS